MENKYRKELDLIFSLLKKYFKEKNLIFVFIIRYFFEKILNGIVSSISLMIFLFFFSEKLPLDKILNSFKDFKGIPPTEFNDIIQFLTIFSMVSFISGLFLKALTNSFFEPAFVVPFGKNNFDFSLSNIFKNCKKFFPAFLKFNLYFYVLEIILLLPIDTNLEEILSLNPLILFLLIFILFLLFFSFMFYIDLLKISSVFNEGSKMVNKYIKIKFKEIMNLMFILSIPHIVILIIILFSAILLFTKILPVMLIGVLLIIIIGMILDILTNFLLSFYFSVYTKSFRNFLKKERSL